MTDAPSMQLKPVDFSQAAHRQALVALLDEYASGPTGRGVPLDTQVRTSLCDALAAHPRYFGWIAWHGEQAVGLVNCFESLSTFRARGLMNVHDVIVTASWRRRGVAAALLEEVERTARSRGCCKMTLEVLEGNAGAARVYTRAGFAPYVLDPAMGRAMLYEKMFN